MLRNLISIVIFMLLTIQLIESLGILELRLKSSQPRRMFICIGPNCLLGRRYLYVETIGEYLAKFNISGGEWQKNFTIALEWTATTDQSKEVRFTHTWEGNVMSTTKDKWALILTSPIQVELRYICAENIYGPHCKVFCKPSFGLTGHFSCGTKGERICNAGWTGIHCTKPDCPFGCGNGTCISPGVCRCQFGFKGNSCQECMAHRGCLHGTCADNVPGTCRCYPGWSGQNCDLPKEYCSVFNPCQNGGTCLNGKIGSRMDYVCQCPNGFGGRHCEGNKTEHICDNRVCLNGGKCVSEVNVTRCDCTHEFIGPNCEVNKNALMLCHANTCSNGGSCIVRDNRVECACSTCFSGPQCETAACVVNATVTFESIFHHSKTAETLVLGLFLLLVLIVTVLLGYYILWQKLRHLILANVTIDEDDKKTGNSHAASENIPQYKVCFRSSFEAPPPYSSTSEGEFKQNHFTYTTLSSKETRICKQPRITSLDGVIV